MVDARGEGGEKKVAVMAVVAAMTVVVFGTHRTLGGKCLARLLTAMGASRSTRQVVAPPS